MLNANRTTALHSAVLSGRIHMVKLLLKHGADIDGEAQRTGGLTPLDYAQMYLERGDMMVHLLESGAQYRKDLCMIHRVL